ncbi:hypothetical protein QJS10_CPA02g00736 [Acorus calamus]|uniref:Pectinesterase inhibitor domain-containing protein n=1 Tax=Acorus calamus TaxID=4465 RepID=A0AAV9FDX3_ACOCL|nr:hypothetical protein QJS10_CPA02g00736 [Acorus calamus]
MSLFLLSLLLFTSVGAITSTGAYNETTQTQITKACKTTPHYDLCFTTLISDPRSPGSDLETLSSLAIDHANSTGADLSSFFLAFSNATYTRRGPHFDLALNDCYDEYMYTSADFDWIFGSMLTREYRDAVRRLDSEAGVTKDCERRFAGRGVAFPEELRVRSRPFIEICEVAAALNS